MIDYTYLSLIALWGLNVIVLLMVASRNTKLTKQVKELSTLVELVEDNTKRQLNKLSGHLEKTAKEARHTRVESERVISIARSTRDQLTALVKKGLALKAKAFEMARAAKTIKKSKKSKKR